MIKDLCSAQIYICDHTVYCTLPAQKMKAVNVIVYHPMAQDIDNKVRIDIIRKMHLHNKFKIIFMKPFDQIL